MAFPKAESVVDLIRHWAFMVVCVASRLMPTMHCFCCYIILDCEGLEWENLGAAE